jgi:hypothetical protein
MVEIVVCCSGRRSWSICGHAVLCLPSGTLQRAQYKQKMGESGEDILDDVAVNVS